MSSENDRRWVPFRPNAADLIAIGKDVSDVGGIQQTLVERNKHIHCPDRVAHQYQIAGSRVSFEVSLMLPRPLPDVGLAVLHATGASAGADVPLIGDLAAEMGANPGNWVHDPQNSIKEPATVFGVARKIAYQRSQAGRGALDPTWYRSVFEGGQISSERARELRRRQDEKNRIGHMSSAR